MGQNKSKITMDLPSPKPKKPIWMGQFCLLWPSHSFLNCPKRQKIPEYKWHKRFYFKLKQP